MRDTQVSGDYSRYPCCSAHSAQILTPAAYEFCNHLEVASPDGTGGPPLSCGTSLSFSSTCGRPLRQACFKPGWSRYTSMRGGYYFPVSGLRAALKRSLYSPKLGSAAWSAVCSCLSNHRKMLTLLKRADFLRELASTGSPCVIIQSSGKQQAIDSDQLYAGLLSGLQLAPPFSTAIPG